MTDFGSAMVFFSRCVFLWVLSAELCLNAWPHESQMNGFSPVCMRRCELKSFDWEKAFEQNWQTYGFSPVCVRLCLAKIPDRENLILHTSHSYGFSPECIRLCFVSELEVVNPWLHMGHTNGRAPKKDFQNKHKMIHWFLHHLCVF